MDWSTKMIILPKKKKNWNDNYNDSNRKFLWNGTGKEIKIIYLFLYLFSDGKKIKFYICFLQIQSKGLQVADICHHQFLNSGMLYLEKKAELK